MSSIKRIPPALAAVLVAAAFVVSCICAPAVAFAYDTQTAAESMLDSVASANNLGGVPSSSSAMVMYKDPSGDLNIRLYNDPTPTIGTSGGEDYIGISGNFYSGYYNDTGYHNGGLGGSGFVVYSDRIRISYAGGNYRDISFGGSGGYQIVGYSLPNTLSGARVAQEAYQSIYELANSSGAYRWASYSPTGTTGSLADTLNDSYKPAVKEGLVTTTTTTTTTSTTTTTTTTAATLPPYPYETSPPFTLPADWTADYSETTPVPDVDYQPPTVDFQPAEIPEEVMSGVGFWFTIFTDFWQQFHLTWVVLLVVGLGFLVYLLWG